MIIYFSPTNRKAMSAVAGCSVRYPVKTCSFSKISKAIILSFLLSTFLLFIPNRLDAVENPYKNHYPFKTAIIYYNVTGYENGKETLYVNSNYQALYIDTQYAYLGKMKPKKVLILTTPEFIYNIDLIKKSGTKLRNLRTDLMKKFDRLSEKEKIIVKNNVKELGVAVIGNIHGKRAPLYEKIVGINCDLIEIFGVRSLMWPGVNIPLKRSRISEYSDKSVVTAVKIDKNVSVTSDKFELPEGVQISFDKYENEKLENKIMTQFHSMRISNAVKIAREEIARMVLMKKIGLMDVDAVIPEEENDSIFADQDVLNSSYEIFIIQNDDELQDDGGGYEFD
tara:strand:+ start:4852 stop:5865 length:1014 start_codon:yes stop_codon:yes gene_type:complete